MNPEIDRALTVDRVMDITTIGRKTGKRHRVEIGVYYDGENLYLSGRPTPKDWHANLLAHPEFTVHLKQSLEIDLLALAVPIVDPASRRQILEHVIGADHDVDDLQRWIARSPLYRVEFIVRDGEG